MKLETLLSKVNHLEGLVIAIEILIDNYIDIDIDCIEEFNSLSSLIRLLRFKTKEIRNDIAKHV